MGDAGGAEHSVGLDGRGRRIVKWRVGEWRGSRAEVRVGPWIAAV